MLPFPFYCGICLGIIGCPGRPRFIVTDRGYGRPALYWTGTLFGPDRREALVFTDFEAARAVAWRLKSDFVWAWYNDFFGKGKN